MRKINFGIFAEDSSSVIFISEVVPKMIAHLGKEVQFIHNESFSKYIHGNSKDRVEKLFIGATVFGLNELKTPIDVCFVGRDADSDTEDDTFDKIEQRFKEKIAQNNIENHIILFFPVRAIEYWLYYTKIKKDNLTIENLEENYSKADMKLKVYERKKGSEKKNNPIIIALCNHIDIGFLIQNSNSFSVFYDELKNFIQSNNLP